MEKSSWGLVIVFLIIGLLVGGLFVGLAMPRTETKYVENKTTDIQYVDKPVIVYQDRNVTQTISVPDAKGYFETLTSDFMNAVEENDTLLTCKGTEYDFDQISVKTVYYNGASLVFNKSDMSKYTITEQIKLKYLDKDLENGDYCTYTVTGIYEPTEDPEITAVLK